MSLKKDKKRGKKKSGGSRSSGPAIPKGHKYLGKAGFYHYIESPTGTIMRGLGESESDYRVESFSRESWTPPKGLTRKGASKKDREKVLKEHTKRIDKRTPQQRVADAKKKEPKKKEPPQVYTDSEGNEYQWVATAKTDDGMKKELEKLHRKWSTAKFYVDWWNGRTIIYMHRPQKKAKKEEEPIRKRTEDIVKKIQKADSFAEIHNLEKKVDKFRGMNKAEAAAINAAIERQSKALKARDRAVKRQREKREKRSKAAKEGIERKKRMEAEAAKKKEEPSQTYVDKKGNEYQHVASAKTDAEAKKQIEFHQRKWSTAQFHVEDIGGRKIIYMHRPPFKEQKSEPTKPKQFVDYVKESDSIPELITTLGEVGRMYADGHLTKADYDLRRAAIFKRTKQLGILDEDNKFAQDLLWTTDLQTQIRVAKTHDEIDAFVDMAKKEGLSKNLIGDIERTAIDAGQSLPVKTVKKETPPAERAKSKDVENIKMFLKYFGSQDDYDGVKNAKTMKQVAKYLDESGDYDNPLLGDKAVILDGSKAAGIAPRWSRNFTNVKSALRKLDDNERPILLPFETHAVLPYAEGVGMYSMAYVHEFVKVIGKKDVTWYGNKDRPLAVEFHDTGDLMIIAPRVERKQTTDTSVEGMTTKEYNRLVQNAHKSREVKPYTNAFYTDKYLYVKLPDGRAVRISKTTTSITDDWDRQAKKSIAAGLEFDGLGRKQLWEFGMQSLETSRPAKTATGGVTSAIWAMIEKEHGTALGLMPRAISDIEGYIKYNLTPPSEETVYNNRKTFAIISDPKKFYPRSKKADPTKMKPQIVTDKWDKKKSIRWMELGGNHYDARELRRMIDLVGKDASWHISKEGRLLAEKDGFQFVLAGRAKEREHPYKKEAKKK